MTHDPSFSKCFKEDNEGPNAIKNLDTISASLLDNKLTPSAFNDACDKDAYDVCLGTLNTFVNMISDEQTVSTTNLIKVLYENSWYQPDKALYRGFRPYYTYATAVTQLISDVMLGV